MRKLVLSFLVIMTSTYAYTQSLADNKLALDVILRTKDFRDQLSLDNLKDRGPIRIVDKTKKFKNCVFTYVPESVQEGLPLEVGVITYVPVDFNTGYYRDFYISNYKKNGDITTVEIYISNYLCIEAKKNRWHYTIKYKIENGKANLISVSSAEWH